MSCIKCNKETKNPKFCSRSCSQSYNNALNPKRKLTNECKRCNQLCWKDRLYCKTCWEAVVKETSKEKWNAETLATVKGTGNANKGGRYSYIRDLARKQYINSNRPKACSVCGYSKHFEVAHIKDIKNFSDDTIISIINKENNLIGLCRNHHWEFDHELM